MRNLELKNEVYDAPKCEVIEVQNEGVLCGSPELNASHGAMSTGNQYNFTDTSDANLWN